MSPPYVLQKCRNDVVNQYGNWTSVDAFCKMEICVSFVYNFINDIEKNYKKYTYTVIYQNAQKHMQ